LLLLFSGWLASDGGLPADQSLPDAPNPIVGASPAGDDGLPATNLSLINLNPCGSWLASDDDLPANQSLPDISNPL
jgi:hypothetical protein